VLGVVRPNRNYFLETEDPCATLPMRGDHDTIFKNL
jgi:hypothetical protein